MLHILFLRSDCQNITGNHKSMLSALQKECFIKNWVSISPSNLKPISLVLSLCLFETRSPSLGWPPTHYVGPVKKRLELLILLLPPPKPPKCWNYWHVPTTFICCCCYLPLFICLFVYVYKYTHPVEHVWRSKGNFQEWVLSFHHVASRDWTQVIRLVGKGFYPLSHLIDPTHPVLYGSGNQIHGFIHAKRANCAIFSALKALFSPFFNKAELCLIKIFHCILNHEGYEKERHWRGKKRHAPECGHRVL